ncbi:MAG: glycosyltransferase family 8 protein [Muribaculaceae bacterium]
MYNFIYSTSNEYAPYCATSIKSMLLNNSDLIGGGNFFILTHDIDDNNKAILQSICADYGVAINIIDCRATIEGLFSAGAKLNFNPSSFLRIFIPEILPNLDKALFVDSDTYVGPGITDLYDINIDDAPCAMSCNMPIYKEMQIEAGLSESDNYYNAGVILLNLKYWRDNNIQQKILDYYYSNGGNFPTDDQSVINALVAKKTLRLHYKYNMMIVGCYYSYKKFAAMNLTAGICTKDEYTEAQRQPVIIHFNGPGVRPWQCFCGHPYTKAFRKVLFSLYPDFKLKMPKSGRFDSRWKIYAQYFKHKFLDKLDVFLNS